MGKRKRLKPRVEGRLFRGHRSASVGVARVVDVARPAAVDMGPSVLEGTARPLPLVEFTMPLVIALVGALVLAGFLGSGLLVFYAVLGIGGGFVAGAVLIFHGSSVLGRTPLTGCCYMVAGFVMLCEVVLLVEKVVQVRSSS